MSEWVTGQPAVSGYFLKLFFLSAISSPYRLFSDFSDFSPGGLFAGCRRAKAAAFEKPTCRNAAAAAADRQLLGGGARSGGGARAA